MARFTRLQTLNAVYDVGVIPLFFNPDIEVCMGVMHALSEGGARVVEFVNRGDFAHEVFAELEKYCRGSLPDLILGAGSVVDDATAGIFIQSGANFIVGPLFNPEVARLCNRRKIAYIPGCATTTEISAAHETGCEIVKVFPAGEVGGPAYVKNILAPMPWTSIMPTGGVKPTEASMSEWFAAGAVCVGMGSALITKDLVQKKDFGTLAANVRTTVGLARKLRAK